MRFFRFLSIIYAVFAVQSAAAQIFTSEDFALKIKPDELYDYVKAMTAPRLEGRKMGQHGGELTRDYLAAELKKIGLSAPSGQSYLQPFTCANGVGGSNVVGVLEGTDLTDEVILLMAHYDYIGRSDSGIIYPGAEDNASGVSALLEIAAAFAEAKKDGYPMERTLVFAFFDGNKSDLAGASYYANNPLFPLDKTVIAINLDMLGRTDGYAEGFSDYVFVLGADRLSSSLPKVVDSINNKYIQLIVDYRFYNNKTLFQLFYPMSDHYAFEKKYVPILFFTSGITGDIHSVGDVADKLSFPVLMRRARLVFQTTWYYATQPVWPELDMLKKKNK